MTTPRRFLFVELLKQFENQWLRFAALVVLCLTALGCSHEGRYAIRSIAALISNLFTNG